MVSAVMRTAPIEDKSSRSGRLCPIALYKMRGSQAACTIRVELLKEHDPRRRPFRLRFARCMAFLQLTSGSAGVASRENFEGRLAALDAFLNKRSVALCRQGPVAFTNSFF
jgi:hypothetical protein